MRGWCLFIYTANQTQTKAKFYCRSGEEKRRYGVYFYNIATLRNRKIKTSISQYVHFNNLQIHGGQILLLLFFYGVATVVDWSK